MKRTGWKWNNIKYHSTYIPSADQERILSKMNLINLRIQWRSRVISKMKLKYMCIIFGLAVSLDLFGTFTHIFEQSYSEDFIYPHGGNISSSIDAFRHNKKPEISPINEYNYSFVFDLKDRCIDKNNNNDDYTSRIIFIVKSAVNHFERRTAIRNSWGSENRFVDVPTKTIFILGIHKDNANLQSKILVESNTYKDILQVDFIDTYYNNTIKTVMGIKWAVTHCPDSRFYMFVDDDMYVSVKNVLAFVRNPVHYPNYLKGLGRSSNRDARNSKSANLTVPSDIGYTNQKFVNVTQVNQSRNMKRYLKSKDTEIPKSSAEIRRQILHNELPVDVKLFSGYVFVSSPHRHKTSKWYVPLREYPYHSWPPYVTAGAYILSKNALMDIYFTSLYTRHFRFDDIFLGLLAKKADIELFHHDEFHFFKRDYAKSTYKYVIASHGFGNPQELVQIWNEQKLFGYA